MQLFLSHREAQLCLVAYQGAASPLHEGLNALLLSAALEYPRVIFRSVQTDSPQNTDWMRLALTAQPTPPLPVIWRVQGERLLSPSLRAAPVDVARPGLPLRDNDVLVVSGGGRGITPHALRGLALAGTGSGCTLVLLGRSATPTAESRALEEAGAMVRYQICDVTDASAVETALEAVYKEFGRIDGVIHAAGLNRDATLAELSPVDTEAVLAVKCRGLRLLLDAARTRGLRYAVAFSSLAGWLGNYGQSNYSAANRAMSALLESWCTAHQLPWRCVWLPPVTGEGMADSAEVRQQLALRGLDKAWLDVSELSDLLARELHCGLSGNVLWARTLPAVPTVLPAPPPTTAALCGLAERPERFGLIFPLALRHQPQSPSPVFVGGHHFSHYADNALRQAPPQDGVPHAPLELQLACLQEAATLPMPWLYPGGLDHVRCVPLPCPRGVTREAELTVTYETPSHGAAWSNVHMRVRDLAANGRRLDRWSGISEGRMLLLPGHTALSPLWEPLPHAQWATLPPSSTSPAHTAIQSNIPCNYAQILTCEEIAHGADSRYAWQWQYLAGIVRCLEMFFPCTELCPHTIRSLRHAVSPALQAHALLETRLRPAPDSLHCDVQLSLPQGDIIMTIQELIFAVPEHISPLLENPICRA